MSDAQNTSSQTASGEIYPPDNNTADAPRPKVARASSAWVVALASSQGQKDARTPIATNTQGVAATTTRVYAQPGFGIPMDVVNGLVRCVHPGIDNHVSFGTVLNVDYDAGLMQSYMDVEDLEGRVLIALTEYGCDLTVLGNYGNVTPGTEPVTSGHWDDVAYDSLTDTTTFTDNSATFPAQAANWWLQPDAARSTYLEIVSLGGSTVTVSGDATGVAQGLTPNPTPGLDPILGNFYTIVWPAGVDPGTGTLAHNDPCEPISRLLFAGYYYMPPVAGTMVQPLGGGTGPHGQQPGANHHGDYYCWNRIYAQKNGVWTSTDPARSMFNLCKYTDRNPLSTEDPTGLEDKEDESTDNYPDDYDSTLARVKRKIRMQQHQRWWDLQGAKECKDGDDLQHVVLYEAADTPASIANEDLTGYGRHIDPATATRSSFRDMESIISALDTITHPKNCKCRCIKTLTLIFHSNSDRPLFLPQPNGPQSISLDAFMFGHLIKGALCPDATINLMGCKTGDSIWTEGVSFGSKSRVRGSVGDIEWNMETDENTGERTVKWRNGGVIVRIPKGRANNEDDEENYMKDAQENVVKTGTSVWE